MRGNVLRIIFYIASHLESQIISAKQIQIILIDYSKWCNLFLLHLPFPCHFHSLITFNEKKKKSCFSCHSQLNEAFWWYLFIYSKFTLTWMKGKQKKSTPRAIERHSFMPPKACALLQKLVFLSVFCLFHFFLPSSHHSKISFVNLIPFRIEA